MQCHRAFPQLESAGEAVGKDAPNRLPFIPNLEALMAYRRFSLIAVSLSLCAIITSALVHAAESFIGFAFDLLDEFDLDWHPDVAASIAADRLSHDIDTKPVDGMRRFRSYLQRLGLHRLFTGDGFAEPQAVGAA